MLSFLRDRRRRRIFLVIGSSIVFLLLTSVVLVKLFLEPLLRNKLEALIVQGSDSLYTYKLGRLDANFFGGRIRIENLNVQVDSTRYRQLKQKNALPSLTIEISLESGDVKGIGLFSLLLGREVVIREIYSKKADIVLIRHVPPKEKVVIRPPLWKAIRPAISAISVKQINLDGVKFLYKPADTAQSMKLQFDRFDALVSDIRIDSAAAGDTNRIAFAKDFFLKFHDMKFRTADSSYKMKAEWITYSSKSRTVEVDSFKLQPTLEKEDFYKFYGVQASLYYLEFDKIRLVNTFIDRFLNNDILEADSVFTEHPRLSVYLDKGQEKRFNSKIGRYPHQQLMKLTTLVRLKKILLKNASVEYTEKNGSTGAEGTLRIHDVDLDIRNATNDTTLLKQNNICTVDGHGRIFSNSPVAIKLRLYLDSANGRFDAEGSIKNVSAAQLNELSVPLANTELPTLDLHSLQFSVQAEDYIARADVRMRYNNLSIILRKIDKETGETVTRKFITKMLNRYAIEPDNPGPGGVERTAEGVLFSRLTTQSFFGVIWKSIFAGMQKIMLKS